MKQIEYYFDFLSPYSYLSWQWVRGSQEFINKLGYDWDYRPVILGSIIQHYETKGPAEIYPKRNYLFKDCLRFAAIHNFPFEAPTPLPFNSLYPLRLALKEVSGGKQRELIDCLFSASWGQGEDISEPDLLKSILDQNGFPAEEWMESMGDKEVRRQLKMNVKTALSKGVFGLPAFLIGEELFWGNDSIPALKKYLEGSDPLDTIKYETFSKRFGDL